MASSKGSEKVLIVSADGHVTAPMADFRPYLESKYHADFDEFVKADDAARAGSRMTPPAAFFDAAQIRPYTEYMIESGAVDGEFDPERRKKELGSQGVAVEVLFSNGSPWLTTFTPAPPKAELLDAGGRAYNRWLVDFVSEAPERFIGQAGVSLSDVDQAVATVEWAREHGLKGVTLQGVHTNAPRLHWDPELDPFWSALEDHDMPASFHGGSGSELLAPPPGVDLRVAFRVLGEESDYMARRALRLMLWSGVFERHPRLKTVWTEQHADWVPSTLAMWDWTWEKDQLWDGQVLRTAPRRPSEYWQQNCWVGMSLASRNEVALHDQIGIDKMMFGVDFPHVESCFPKTLPTLQALCQDLTDDEMRSFLGLNAAALWNLDVDRLAPVVDEVGFTVDELRTPAPEGVLFGSDISLYNPDLNRPA